MTAPSRDSGVAPGTDVRIAAVGDLLGARRGALCAVTADGTGLAPRWTFGYSDRFLAGWSRVDLAHEAPLTDAARLGTTVVLRSREELSARYPGIVHHVFDDTGAMLSVPLTDPDGAVVGVLALSFADAAALDVARLAAEALAPGFARQVIDTAPGRVGVDDRGAAVRPGEPHALQRLARRLLGTLTLEELASAVDAHAPAVVDAAFARLLMVDPDGGQRLVLTGGTDADADEIDRRYAVVPPGAPVPANEAARTGAPVWLGTRAELLRRFPALAEFPLPVEALAALPLDAVDAPRGVLVLGWLRPTRLETWEREACLQVAELCGQALGRAFSYTEQQRARAAAERATARLQALTALAAELGACTTPEAVGDVLISTALRTIGADAASAMAADASGALRVLAWSADVEVGDTGLTGLALADLALVREQLATRRPVFVRSRAERELRYPDMSGVAVKQQAWANLPLFVGDRFVGAVAFGWDEIRDFPPDEQEFLTTLARHVAVALDRARLMTAARTASETLQQALLPEVGPIDGIEAASRYVPVVEGSDVGGDWYDVFPLAGGRLGLTIGDVEGKGVGAAAVMGTVRSVLRAYATVTTEPDVVLREVDDYLRSFGDRRMVTATCAVVDPRAGRIAYSAAGHPPPLLVLDGRTVWLDEAGGAPLGIVAAAERRVAQIALPAGPWALLLYTDGLVERRSALLREGMADIARAAPVLRDAPDLDAALGTLVDTAAGHPDRTYDDVAALVLRGGDGAREVHVGPRRST